MTEAEFEAVYERTARPLRAYLLRLGGNTTLADDVLQDTYCRFLSMEPAKRQAAPERPLLYRIATNLMHDQFRRLRRERRAPLEWPPPHVEGVGPDLPHDMARVFAELKPQQRSLLWLAYVEGWSHVDIAAGLGLRSRSIRVLLFRAKSALAQRMRSRGLAPEVDR